MRIVLAVALTLLAPLAAAAKCAAPSPFVSPEAGTSIPPGATLFVFLPSWRGEGAVDVRTPEGKPVVHTRTALSKSPAFAVERLVLGAGVRGEVVVTLADRQGAEPRRLAGYRVGEPASCAAEKPVTIRKVEDESHAWTCSYQQTVNLTPSVVAPAYRVRYARSEADLRAGKVESVVVPYRMERFFHWKDERWEAPAAGQVELGHVNCTGKTIEWTDGPLWVSVSALYVDGTEDPAGEPVRLEPPGPARRSR